MSGLWWLCPDGAVAWCRDGVGHVFRGGRWLPLVREDIRGRVMHPAEVEIFVAANGVPQ